jgi:hypothetical protein
MAHLEIRSPTSTDETPADKRPEKLSQRRILAAYKQMLVALFIATLGVIALLTAFILPSLGRQNLYLMPIVALAGSLGAFFSVLMRFYNFQDLPKAVVSEDLDGLPSAHLVVYSLVPAVVGAIAAAVIYMLFASSLLQDGIFPSFVCKFGEDKCDSFYLLIDGWSPKSASDYAKVIVWGFAAGFIERLVPDALQSLSRSAQKENGHRETGG